MCGHPGKWSVLDNQMLDNGHFFFLHRNTEELHGSCGLKELMCILDYQYSTRESLRQREAN